MIERIRAGVETFAEDQRLLYSVMYIGLRRAIDRLRQPEPAEVYGLESADTPDRQENLDTVYPAAA